MATTVRTDIHRPSAIKPEEYEFVSFDYYGGSDLGAILAVKSERERFRAHMATSGGKFSGHEHGGICHICGCGNIVYACIFYHAATNAYIVTGEDCAAKMEMGYDVNGMSAFRSKLKAAGLAVKGKLRAKAKLEGAGLSECWALYEMEFPTGGFPGYEESTIRDIVSKLVKYGDISEKAERYLHVLVKKIASRAERAATRAAEAEAAAPCPTGRIEVTGTVVALKVVDGFYGPSTKMLVKAESGFKVWGTRTANFEKGDKVRFTATVEPSKDDPKFGFFKRPTKGEVLVPAHPVNPPDPAPAPSLVMA